MRFLIVGLGSIGRRHFCNLIALGEKNIVLLRSHRAILSGNEPAGAMLVKWGYEKNYDW